MAPITVRPVFVRFTHHTRQVLAAHNLVVQARNLGGLRLTCCTLRETDTTRYKTYNSWFYNPFESNDCHVLHKSSHL